MHCPRCHSTAIRNAWHKPYGAQCATCGLFGSLQLAEVIAFVPDGDFKQAVLPVTHGWGGWHKPLTYIPYYEQQHAWESTPAAFHNAMVHQTNMQLTMKYGQSPISAVWQGIPWPDQSIAYWLNGGSPFTDQFAGECYEYGPTGVPKTETEEGQAAKQEGPGGGGFTDAERAAGFGVWHTRDKDGSYRLVTDEEWDKATGRAPPGTDYQI